MFILTEIISIRILIWKCTNELEVLALNRWKSFLTHSSSRWCCIWVLPIINFGGFLIIKNKNNKKDVSFWKQVLWIPKRSLRKEIREKQVDSSQSLRSSSLHWSSRLQVVNQVDRPQAQPWLVYIHRPQKVATFTLYTEVAIMGWAYNREAWPYPLLLGAGLIGVFISCGGFKYAC